MKILLDECVTKHLKKYLTEFDVCTVSEMGWSGIKNGKLMQFCTENGFDILLTIDKNLMFQQNIEKYALTIVAINCPTSKLEALLNYLPNLKQQIQNFEKGKSYVIDK